MEDLQHNYKMVIAYDGTFYSGWQIQDNAPSIQQHLQEAIKIVLKTDVNVIGSGRTDSGVHALGQVANFKHSDEIDLFRFFASLNALLPKDIRVIKIEKAPLKFHAQHSALSKTYHYHIRLNRIQDPFKRLYSFHVREKIDLDLLKQAAALFIGTHDFASLANEAHSGCAAYDSIRTMQEINLVLQEEGIRLEFKADGFLYKMVRNIVGTLLEVAAHKRAIETIPPLFDTKDRRKAGMAAPPHGLFLMQVDYPNT